MGIDTLNDPDVTYQLTEDNLNKLLAIHMRLRTNLPIIVMTDRDWLREDSDGEVPLRSAPAA